MTTGASNDRNQSSPLLFVIEAVFVIASEAKQSMHSGGMDCHALRARNDERRRPW
jgi:hypothetical protein